MHSRASGGRGRNRESRLGTQVWKVQEVGRRDQEAVQETRPALSGAEGRRQQDADRKYLTASRISAGVLTGVGETN